MSSTDSVSTVAQRLLKIAEEKVGIPPVRKELARLQEALKQAEARLRATSHTLKELTDLLRNVDVAIASPCLTEAEGANNAAGEAVSTARRDLSAAQSTLDQLRGSISLFVEIATDAGRLSPSDLLHAASKRYLLEEKIKEAERIARDWHPVLVQADTARRRVTEAQDADKRMEGVCKAAPSKANRAAKAATLALLEEAQRQLNAVNQADFEAAEASLSVFPEIKAAIKAFNEAHNRAVRQDYDLQMSIAASRRVADADDGSGCTCSENYRCPHCYQMQNDSATGQGQFAPERTWGD